MNRTLAIVLLITLAVTIVFIPIAAAKSESPTIEQLTKIESKWMKLSSFPNNVMPFDVIRVDMDMQKIWNEYLAEVDVEIPHVPDNLEGVILTDGYHISEAICVPEGNVLHLRFHVNELKKFDSTVGLWLVTLIKLK